MVMAQEPEVSVVLTVAEWVGKLLVSAIAGACSAYKWFCRKLEAVESKANTQISALQGQIDILDSDTVKRMGHMDARIQEHTTRLAVGEKAFENVQEQLDVMMDGQRELVKKQDRIVELLIDLRRGHHERS